MTTLAPLARAVASLSLVAALMLGSAAPAIASETLAYSYDALGRLIKVARSGTANNGASECYAYDPASNRSNVTVATSSDCSSGGGGTISFSIASNGPVTEGAPSVFTITKTGTATASLSVSYATANGSAVAPGDYTAKALTTLTFTTTQSSQTVSVTTIDDTVVESAETFSMALSAPTGGATLGTPSSATATINDNDGGGGGTGCSGVSFSVNNASGDEGAPIVFTVTKTGSTSSSCSLNYATANSSAVEPGDYVAASGTLTFSSTQASLTVSVTTNINGVNAEPDETFFLNLSGATSGAAISDAQGVGTIFDVYDPNPCPLC